MKPSPVYWDANVFHALFGREDGRVEKCEKIESAARAGRIQIYTSTITWVECVRLKGKPRIDPANEPVIRAYFEHRWITPITVDRTIADDARALLWKYEHLRYKDAVHVASAI